MSGQQHASPEQSPPLMSTEQNMSVAEDFGSNQCMMTEVDGQGSGTAAAGEAARSLGDMDGLNGGFASAAGSVVDLLTPDVGDKGKIELSCNIPLEQTGTVKLNFGFIGEAERSDAGMKIKADIRVGVVASREIDVWFAKATAFARVGGLGYIEANGDSGAECFRLMTLSLQEQVRDIDEDIADIVFRGVDSQAIIARMDGDDYVDSGVGFQASAGVSLDVGDDPVAGAGAAYEYRTGTRLDRPGGSGDVRESHVSQHQVELAGSVSPFSVAGKVVWAYLNNSMSKVEGEISGEYNYDLGEMASGVVLGDLASRYIAGLADVLTGRSAMIRQQDESAARQVGSIIGFLEGTSGTGFAVDAGAQRALSRMSERGLGMELKHKLTVKAGWEAGRGLTGEVALERVESLSVGDDPNTSAVYVMLENIDPVLRLAF